MGISEGESASVGGVLTVNDLRRMGRGVTHWMMATSAVVLEQLTTHTWLVRVLVAHSV